MAKLVEVESPSLLAGGTAAEHDLTWGIALRPPDLVGCVRRALVMLRDPDSTEELLSRIPAAVSTLGFDRVVYARLCGTRWTPVSSFGPPPEPEGDDGTELAELTRLLDVSAPEYVVLAELRPVVVNPGRADRLLAQSWCPAYVAVPVIERGAAVGVIHAGYATSRRPPDALDQEVLWTFGEALASAFASASAIDNLRDLIARMSAVACEFSRQKTPGSGFRSADIAHAPSLSAGSLSAGSLGAGSLSARELEVLELMAAGQTNGQIARRLVITEGTTKSHVKRIMRKLHAANRAEAVAAWMRLPDRVPFSRI